jgi:hypothetical protein
MFPALIAVSPAVIWTAARTRQDAGMDGQEGVAAAVPWMISNPAVFAGSAPPSGAPSRMRATTKSMRDPEATEANGPTVTAASFSTM